MTLFINPPYYAATVLKDSPIRYYRLNETSGTTATDLGSQAQNGTIAGSGVSYNQTKLISAPDAGGSMTFDGAAGYVSIPTTSLPTGTGNWSIEAWASSASTGSTSHVVCGMGTAARDQQAELWIMDQLYARADLNTDTFNNFRSWALGTSQPAYLVVTYDGHNIRLYQSGLAIDGGAITMNMAFGVAYIGRTVGGSFHAITVSDVAIYNTTLSAQQIARHWRVGTA